MTTRRPTLLLVDDEPEVLHSIQDLLRLDYRVLVCERGEDAVKILESDASIQVVMSDQRMPGMTGIEVLQHARRLRPEATRLIFTAWADIRAVIDSINQGHVFRYITKPWEPEELQQVVRQAVEQHDLITERDRLVSELKETNARLVEADRLKAAFIEVASHELNTPVAVVLGMTQLWRITQGENADPAEKNWVDRIYHAGKRLASTVERMLKLVRCNDLSSPLQIELTPLAPLVRGAVDEMGTFLVARKQRIEVDLAPDLGSAEIDRAKIGDVLMNLLINAVKFTPDGGQIRVAASADGPDRVRFVIADHGVGIDPALRPFLFEPFFTGFDTMHHSSGDFEYGKRGIGLGLSLVRRFVDLHGGTVDVSSTPGLGSTFVVTLPRRRANATPVDGPKAIQVEPPVGADGFDPSTAR